MVMMSGVRRRARTRADAGFTPPSFVRCGADLRFVLAGEPVRALKEGGLYLEAHGVLIVSDLHMEKGSSFARRGQLLPPYDTRETLARLARVCGRTTPSTVVSLGDSFHDGEALARMDSADVATLESLIGAHRWIWISGNHDPETPADLDGVRAKTVQFGKVTLRHEPEAGAAHGEIAGHLHPAARVSGEARSVRARCFATDGSRLVMPAFGAYTGGLNLSDPAFAGVFPHGAVALALGGRQLYPIAPDRQF